MEKIENEDFEQEEKIGGKQEFDDETEEILELTEEEAEVVGGGSGEQAETVMWKVRLYPECLNKSMIVKIGIHDKEITYYDRGLGKHWIDLPGNYGGVRKVYMHRSGSDILTIMYMFSKGQENSLKASFKILTYESQLLEQGVLVWKRNQNTYVQRW